MKSGVIRSSLFAATDAAAIPDSIAMQIADIFGGDIDFHRGLRKGDQFSIVYEQLTLNGRPVRVGRVLAADFRNQSKSHRAVWYSGADGKGGYYGADGKNLRKAFLRSPLEYSRISSGFGMRHHPFLQTWRAHNGVDYAAPAGTRVRAVGDGVIDFVGAQGGYGNVIIVRHPGNVTTVYAHLMGFTRGLRKGANVAQGDIIGAVGQSGWATGPHLHYEFRTSGQARNPLAVVLPAALPIDPGEMKAFRGQADPLAARLDMIGQGDLALLE
jgi:murein DD-endopeptidase MepM/ murein hydrolase activator NlpD